MNKPLFKINFKNIAIILLIAIFFIADRYLKMLALDQSLKSPIKLVGDFFLFNFTPNYYIAFSLPIGGWILNIIILTIIACFIFAIFRFISQGKYYITTALLTFVTFGAISNIIDRLVFGYVVDYLELRYFATFNLADAMISLGVIAILLLNFKREKYV